jgi:hypothetical protein
MNEWQKRMENNESMKKRIKGKKEWKKKKKKYRQQQWQIE